MATTYNTTTAIGSQRVANTGSVRRIWDRFVEARQKEANRRVLSHLRRLDLDQLRQLGYSEEQISLIVSSRG